MTDQNIASQDAAAPTPPVADATPAAPAPRSDAEALQLDQDKTPAAPPAPKPEDAEADRKKNRTREYIARLNRENAELRERVAQAATPAAAPAARAPAAPSGAPTIDQYDFDHNAHQAALTAWAVEQALKQREESSKQADSAKQERDRLADYNTKAAEFAEDHPDFYEVVGSIDTKFLTNELQAAVMAHENGAAIAYHLATNDDDLWQLASIRPDLMAAAVARLASRLTATPSKAPAIPNPIPAIPSAPAPPVSRTPPPVPAVAGRAPSETPSEKLTDDDWYAKDREKRRKR